MKTSWVVAVLCVVVLAFSLVLLDQRREHKRERVKLLEMIANKVSTTEVKPGVFEKESVDFSDVDRSINEMGSELSREIERLSEHLESVNRHAVAMLELAVSQKEKKVSGKAKSVQTSVSQAESAVPRKKVDFDLRLSRFRISGHTLTDPAESFVELEEIDPLKIAVAVSRSKDGRWIADATAADGARVDIGLSVVDEKPLAKKWSEKISVQLGVGFVPDQSLTVGASYGERFALGPSCQVSSSSASCGVVFSWRPFFK